MKCPTCKSSAKVLETRCRDVYTTRRWQCKNCFVRFTTMETLMRIGARSEGASPEQMAAARAKRLR